MTHTPEVSVEPTREEVMAFANEAFRNSRVSRFSKHDLDDISGALATFARHRLASQTPPATQPSATVGEVERVARALCLTFGENPMAKVQAGNSVGEAIDVDLWELWQPDARKFLAALATLHTPPPVATATVVDAGAIKGRGYMASGPYAGGYATITIGAQAFSADEVVRALNAFSPPAAINCFGIPDTYRGFTIEQGPDDRFYARIEADTWEDLREVLDALAATPTPTAGER